MQTPDPHLFGARAPRRVRHGMTFLRWHLRKEFAGPYVASAAGRSTEVFETREDLIRFFLRLGATRSACDRALVDLASGAATEAELRVPRDPVLWME